MKLKNGDSIDQDFNLIKLECLQDTLPLDNSSIVIAPPNNDYDTITNIKALASVVHRSESNQPSYESAAVIYTRNEI